MSLGYATYVKISLIKYTLFFLIFLARQAAGSSNNTIAASLSRVWLLLPRLGDCTQEGQPSVQGHSFIAAPHSTIASADYPRFFSCLIYQAQRFLSLRAPERCVATLFSLPDCFVAPIHRVPRNDREVGKIGAGVIPAPIFTGGAGRGKAYI